MNLKTGHLLADGRYRVERVLGQGGFGITYLCEQTALLRKVAVKEFFMREYCERDNDTATISLGSSGSRDMVERFRQKFVKEARTLAALNHKHIVRIIDIFEENNTAYYVMEYVGGGSLSDKVKDGALPEEVALRYIRQVAAALDFVHSKNMMHLDIKPSNILLGDNDETVLIDFGLAKQYDAAGSQTSTTPVGISHGYAPLEQYRQGGVGTFSPATDIYSLGATLYKLLAGETPPDAGDVNDDGLPALPQHISAPVRAAIEAAMQPRRKDRPQSIDEFLALLECHSEQSEESPSNDGETVLAGTFPPVIPNVCEESHPVDAATALAGNATDKEILRSAQNDKERVEEDDSNRALVISTERSDGGETVVDRHFSVHSEKSSSNDCEEIKELNIVGKMELRYNKKYVYAVSASSILFFLSLFMPIYDDCSVYFYGWFHNDDIQYGVDLCFLYSISFKVYMFIVAMNPILQILKGDNKYYRVLTTLIGCAGLVYVVPFLDDVLYGDIWYGLFLEEPKQPKPVRQQRMY